MPSDYRLIYKFHKKEYYGAAHGLSGVLYMLLKSYELNKNHIDTDE